MIDYFLFILFSFLAAANAVLIFLFLLPSRKFGESFSPPISIVVPAHNEERYIAETIRSIQHAKYKNKKEIIVIDDGSTDGTARVVREIAKKTNNIKLFSIRHSGKSAALNYGIRKSSYDIIAYLDADSFLGKNSLKELVKPLADKNIAISSGIIRARHTKNPLTWFQDIEYVASSGWRYACDKIDATYIAPGFAAFKKSAVMKVGGFSRDTLTEDIDTTLELRKAGYGAAMSRAVMFTSVPSGIRSLMKQRIRWGRGSIQTAKKHSDMIFSKKSKMVGVYSFPMHLFWYLFALVYMPFAIYWVSSAYLGTMINFVSFYTLIFFIKWFTIYGMADLFYNILTGAYALTPLLFSIISSWALSFTYILLSMRKFKAFSWKGISYFIIFPYYWAIFVVQGLVLIYEMFSRGSVNIWGKFAGNSA